nr:hypothetical protein [Pieris rapae granulovirus]
MKRCYYFQDVHPVNIFYFNNNNYYFKLNQLADCFHLCFNTIRFTTNPRFLVNFDYLKTKHPNTTYTLHPATLLLHIQGLDHFMTKFCAKSYCDLFLHFLNECFLHNNKCVNELFQICNITNSDIDDNNNVNNLIDKYESVKCVYGVLASNIEFILIQNKKYFKGVDVARYINCTPSYCINKYVDDNNMVLWYDLKQYIQNNFIWLNYENRWKNNTIFLKEKGIKQLLMATIGDDEILRDMLINVDNYDAAEIQQYKKQKPVYTKKLLKAYECTVGKMNGVVDFIVTPDQNVYYKLHQIAKYYMLKINNYDYYKKYLLEWFTLKLSLKKCNINWKPNLILIEGQGIYKMLTDVGLNVEAQDFIYSKMYEAKCLWTRQHKFKVKV